MNKPGNVEGVHTHTHTQYKFNRRKMGSSDYFKSVEKENGDLLDKYKGILV